MEIILPRVNLLCFEKLTFHAPTIHAICQQLAGCSAIPAHHAYSRQLALAPLLTFVFLPTSTSSLMPDALAIMCTFLKRDAMMHMHASLSVPAIQPATIFIVGPPTQSAPASRAKDHMHAAKEVTINADPNPGPSSLVAHSRSTACLCMGLDLRR